MSSFNEADHARGGDGRWAAMSTSETAADVLGNGQSLQTDQPLQHMSLQASNRNVTYMLHPDMRDQYDFDPPYQRGDVWDIGKRRAQIHSMLRGIPVPAVIINDRFHDDWHPKLDFDHGQTPKMYAVVDGKQRMETMRRWVDDQLSVPASWFRPEHVQDTRATADGPYVSRLGQTPAGRRLAENRMTLPVAEAKVDSVQQEAALYQLVNGGGVTQTDEDMQRAADVSAGHVAP